MLIRPLAPLRVSRIFTLTSWVTLSFLVPDHWFKTFLIGFIFYNLLTPVRKQDEVRSFGFLVLPALFVTKITSRIGVVNLVRELIMSWFLQQSSIPQFTVRTTQETLDMAQFPVSMTGETGSISYNTISMAGERHCIINYSRREGRRDNIFHFT